MIQLFGTIEFGLRAKKRTIEWKKLMNFRLGNVIRFFLGRRGRGWKGGNVTRAEFDCRNHNRGMNSIISSFEMRKSRWRMHNQIHVRIEEKEGKKMMGLFQRC